MEREFLDRLPPSNFEAERAVLGASLLDREALEEALELLTAEDFYDLNHRDVFESICNLVKQDVAVDYLTLSDELRKAGMWEKLGGQTFLASIVDCVPTAANVEYHAKIVKDKALRRRLISAGNSIVRSGYSEDREINDILEEAERSIFEISRRRNESNFQWVAEIIKPTFKHIEKQFSKADSRVTGIATGFAGIDRITGGLQRGSLNILAARPSMGKTALALNIARNVAMKVELPVLVFSLEMSASQLVQRLLGSEANINIHDLITGGFAQEDWSKLHDAADRLMRCPIYIDDSSLLNTMEMKARCRRFKAKYGDIGLIVVDYLQLMSSSRPSDSRQQDVSEISRALKAVARELEAPVLSLSQLSRESEKRVDKRPQLSDLRDSGAIEQDADLVAMLFRESYYGRNQEGEGFSFSQKDPASLDIAKHRNGPTGVVNLMFVREYTKFYDVEYHHRS